jgi:predicted AlkP superfamily phosphohydrolase/phosphomutase
MQRSKLVVIGWHGGNWKSIHPLIDAGLMPNFAALVERGVAGNLAASGPIVPAALWTSIATGKPADEHGILTAFEPDPLSGSIRESTSLSRNCKALWNIAMQSGRIVHTAGWPATFPAEPLNGSCTTSRFSIPGALVGQPWPVPENAFYPPRLEAHAADLRVHAGELTGQEIVQFIPKLSQIDQEQDSRVIEFADLLARAISQHAIVTWIMEYEPWDVYFIGWEALDRAAQRFMRYAPPAIEETTPKEREWYGEVVKGVHCFHDMMLGRILQLAGDDATIAVMSPLAHRTTDDAPPPSMRFLPGGWYRPHGIFCIAGPNILEDELIHGANLLDLAPTLLSAIGVAPAQDMPGRVLDIFREKPALDRIPSWEDVPGECGMHPAESESDRQAAEAALRALEDAGYALPPENEWAARIRRERALNTALLALTRQNYSEARRILIALSSEPGMLSFESTRVALWLAQCHLLCGDTDSCRATASTLPKDGLSAIFSGLLFAHLELAEHRIAPALEALESAERAGAGVPVVNYAAGLLYIRLRHWEKAEQRLKHAVELDPTFQAAQNTLAALLAVRGKGDEAAEVALQSLQVDYGSALGHLAFGIAMAGTGDGDEALKAFERSSVFDPNLPQARAWARAIGRSS